MNKKNNIKVKENNFTREKIEIIVEFKLKQRKLQDVKTKNQLKKKILDPLIKFLSDKKSIRSSSFKRAVSHISKYYKTIVN